MNNIDYKAVVEILENFLKKEKTEILGISVGEERQLRLAIENILKRNKELEADNYECNNIINDYIDTVKKKDKIINLMTTMIDNYDSQLEINIFKDKEHIKRFVKETLTWEKLKKE